MAREPDSEKARGDDRLGALAARLKAAREAGAEGRARARAEKRARSKADGIAWRVSAELVAAFLVCGFVGWWVDEWVGSRPVFLIVGLLLGGVVGIRNVYRVAREISQAAEKEEEDG